MIIRAGSIPFLFGDLQLAFAMLGIEDMKRGSIDCELDFITHDQVTRFGPGVGSEGNN